MIHIICFLAVTFRFMDFEFANLPIWSCPLWLLLWKTVFPIAERYPCQFDFLAFLYLTVIPVYILQILHLVDSVYCGRPASPCYCAGATCLAAAAITDSVNSAVACCTVDGGDLAACEVESACNESELEATTTPSATTTSPPATTTPPATTPLATTPPATTITPVEDALVSAALPTADAFIDDSGIVERFAGLSLVDETDICGGSSLMINDYCDDDHAFRTLAVDSTISRDAAAAVSTCDDINLDDESGVCLDDAGKLEDDALASSNARIDNGLALAAYHSDKMDNNAVALADSHFTDCVVPAVEPSCHDNFEVVAGTTADGLGCKSESLDLAANGPGALTTGDVRVTAVCLSDNLKAATAGHNDLDSGANFTAFPSEGLDPVGVVDCALTTGAVCVPPPCLSNYLKVAAGAHNSCDSDGNFTLGVTPSAGSELAAVDAIDLASGYYCNGDDLLLALLRSGNLNDGVLGSYDSAIDDGLALAAHQSDNMDIDAVASADGIFNGAFPLAAELSHDNLEIVDGVTANNPVCTSDILDLAGIGLGAFAVGNVCLPNVCLDDNVKVAAGAPYDFDCNGDSTLAVSTTDCLNFVSSGAGDSCYDRGFAGTADFSDYLEINDLADGDYCSNDNESIPDVLTPGPSNLNDHGDSTVSYIKPATLNDSMPLPTVDCAYDVESLAISAPFVKPLDNVDPIMVKNSGGSGDGSTLEAVSESDLEMFKAIEQWLKTPDEEFVELPQEFYDMLSHGANTIPQVDFINPADLTV